MTRDIDTVIDIVRASLPNVDVVQMHKTHPADDDGIWWFRLPDVANEIQLESSFGVCPFLVEHDGMTTPDEAWSAATVDEAAIAVIEFLARNRADGQQGV